jgi:hypothetical protein
MGLVYIKQGAINNTLFHAVKWQNNQILDCNKMDKELHHSE